MYLVSLFSPPQPFPLTRHSKALAAQVYRRLTPQPSLAFKAPAVSVSWTHLSLRFVFVCTCMCRYYKRAITRHYIHMLGYNMGVWCDNGYSIISTIELLYDIMQYLHRFIYFTAAIFRFAIISYYSFLPPYIPYAFLIVTRLWLIAAIFHFCIMMFIHYSAIASIPMFAILLLCYSCNSAILAILLFLQFCYCVHV